jgi:hypothetical protein
VREANCPVHILYLDDSGSASNPNEKYLVLGGISVFERQVHWLCRELDELAARISPETSDLVEFHASEMFSGRTPPWKSMPKERRRAVIKEVLGVVARSHESTKVFACAVHKASFPNADPMEIAFEELCMRFDLQLKRLYSVDKNPQRGIIILDESTYETSLQALARNFRVLGARWGVLVNLADVPLFVDSRASRAVQLADHIAYAVFRRYEAGDTNYFDVILPKFDSVANRLHGLVHREPGNPNCMCPACFSRRVAHQEFPRTQTPSPGG